MYNQAAKLTAESKHTTVLLQRRLGVKANKLIGKQPQLFITVMKQNPICEASAPLKPLHRSTV